MSTYKKRNESSIVTACLRKLQCLENAKQIAWYSRMNSGDHRIFKEYVNRRGIKKKYFHYIRGCRIGTPDIQVVLLNGITIWFEVKQPGETTKEEQIKFSDIFNKLEGHVCYVITDIDMMDERIKKWI